MDAHDSRSTTDVNEILKRKRKIREHKACYPCRKRKVKCDSQTPCKTCVNRNHPDLCTFNPPSKRRDSASTFSPDDQFRLSIRQDDWDRVQAKLASIEESVSDVKNDLQRLRGGGGIDEPSLTGSPLASPTTADSLQFSLPGSSTGAVYLPSKGASDTSGSSKEVRVGAASIPALVSSLGKESRYRAKVQEVFGDNFLPLFGLDNESSSPPFFSLWGQTSPQVRMEELSKLLPSENECRELFKEYRRGPCVMCPALADVNQFEVDLMSFLTHRHLNRLSEGTNPEDQRTMNGMSLAWVALLYAVFASGVQFSITKSKKERQFLSHVYGCCAFECLRIINFLANPSYEVVQALLVMGNVLTNGMNAGACWSLLGMTIRLARSIGLDLASHKPRRLGGTDIPTNIWWGVLWMDSMLSLSFGRATSACLPDGQYPPLDQAMKAGQGGLGYTDCMHRVTRIALLTVRHHNLVQNLETRLAECASLREQIPKLKSQAALHLRDVKRSSSAQEQCEFWALRLHCAFISSELCRPGISPETGESEKSHGLRKLCVTYLMETVEAFLGLASSSPVHTRAWVVQQRALSSALLLGILGEALRNQHAQLLLRRLITSIRNVASVVDAGELVPSVARSVAAVEQLCATETTETWTMDRMRRSTGQEALHPPKHYHGGHGRAASTGMNSTLMDAPRGSSPMFSEFDMFTGEFDATSMLPGAEEKSIVCLPSALGRDEGEQSPHSLMDAIMSGTSRSKEEEINMATMN